MWLAAKGAKLVVGGMSYSLSVNHSDIFQLWASVWKDADAWLHMSQRTCLAFILPSLDIRENCYVACWIFVSMLKLCHYVISDLGSLFEDGSVFEHGKNKMSSSSGSSNCRVDTTTGNENDSKSKWQGENHILQLNPSSIAIITSPVLFFYW